MAYGAILGQRSGVQTVNGQLPDVSGNVNVTATGIGAMPTAGGTMTGPIHMSGQVIDGLNEPTNETEAARKGYVDKSVRAAAPVNLLDNSDFRNPVNQRGVTTWNYIGYGIDRWFTNGASANISVTRNGLQGSADFLVQKFEKTKLNGASKVTAVVQVNGAIYFGVLNISNFTPGSDIVVITGIPGISRVNLYHEDNDICQFYFAGLNSVTIEWAALYAGEYTTQTLPEYRTKGYSVELLECLRYYRKYKQGRLCTGLCYNTTTALFAIQQGVPMRIVPTVVSAVGNVLTRAGIKQATYTGSFYSTVSVATFDMSTSGLISGEVCMFEGILELSADL